MSTSYVIDTSVLMQGVLEEDETARVQTLLFLAAQSEDVLLHIPEFALVEGANVLWKQVRFQGESVEEARQRLKDLHAFPLQTYASAGLLPRALEIGLASQLAVYDCVHIALAEHLACPLITVDDRAASGVQLKSITDFPKYSPGEN